MIVKVAYPEKGWVYLEGDRVYSEEIPESETETHWGSCLVFLYHIGKVGRKIMKISVYKKDEIVSQILTDCLSFLLNEEGKTLDRLN